MEKSISLFQISQELLDIFDVLEENEGELTPELEKRLAIGEEQLNDKAVSYRKAITYVGGQSKLIKEEINRLRAMQKKFDKSSETLQSSLLQSVLLFGTPDAKLTKAQETHKKNGVDINPVQRLNAREVGNIINLSNRQTIVCKIEDEDILSSEYINLQLPKLSMREIKDILYSGDMERIRDFIESGEESINKSLITTHLKNGVEVRGASLEVSHSLTIK